MSLEGYNDVQVERAFDALSEYMKTKSSNDMFEGEGKPIDLQIGMKKVPEMKKKILISLPHSLLMPEEDVCLFVKDVNLKDHEETERHYKEVLRKKGVTNIAEVIPLRRIKTEFKEFEAKRNLSNLYSAFLADDRILRLLPGFLGKAFYKGNKMPAQVNLGAKDLTKEINTILDRACCQVKGRGPSCQVKVGGTSLKRTQNLANIRAAIAKVVEEIPGGVANIKSLHLRSPDTPALPIYVTFKSADDVVLPVPEKKNGKKQKEKAEDVTPVEGFKIIAKGNADFKLVRNRKPKKKSKVAAATEEVRKRKRKTSETEETATPKKKK